MHQLFHVPGNRATNITPVEVKIGVGMVTLLAFAILAVVHAPQIGGVLKQTVTHFAKHPLQLFVPLVAGLFVGGGVYAALKYTPLGGRVQKVIDWFKKC